MNKVDCFEDMAESDINRFWSNVAITENKDECWEWMLSKNDRGYGRFSFVNKSKYAVNARTNRIAYFLYNKNIDYKLLVCHTCDNPSCCNPNHLFLGTSQDNVDDMIKKGRFYIGLGEERSKKLTEKDVIEIIDLFKLGLSQKEIAERFNLNQSNVSRIVSGKRWGHLRIAN